MAAKQIDREFTAAGKRAGTAAGDAIGSEVEKSAKEAGRNAGRSLTDAIDQSTRQMGAGFLSRFATHGSAAGRNFGSAFGTSLTSSIPVVGGFTSAMSGYETAAGKAGAVAGRAMGVAFTTAAAGLIGAAGYTIFKGFERYKSIDAAKNRLENLNRTLEGTGRAGINVKQVMDTVNDVVLDTPVALDKAFSIAARALSSNTGDLKRFMTVAADAAAFAQEPIEGIGDALLKIANTGKVSMEEISNELRNIPILPWLQQELHVTGSELSKMISDGKVGLEDLMRAIEKNAAGFAKGSGATIEGAIEQINTAVARLGANFLGSIFGKPTEDGNELVDVLGTLKERLDDVNRWVTAHQDDIKKFFETAVQVGGDLVGVLGDIAELLGEHPGLVYTVVGAWAAFKAAGVAASLTTTVTALTGTNAALTAMPALAGAASAALGPLAVAAAGVGAAFWWWKYISAKPDFVEAPPVLPNMPTNLDGTPKPGGIQSIPGTAPAPTLHGIPTVGGIPMPGLNPTQAPQAGQRVSGMPTLPGHGLHWEDGKGWVPDTPAPPGSAAPAGPAGNPILPPPGTAGGSGSGTGPKLPGAPVLPYDTTLPANLFGLAPDASVFGAESSFLDARHRLAEKRARVTQLEQTADATEEDRLNARNDAVEAERDLRAAEMRLTEARTGQYEQMVKAGEKQLRQMSGLTKDLGELGASLDADFGISKGLAGIAENITKFVANLAAAPLLGKLGAVSALSPSQGGYGALGIAAAQGAFGPDYTGIDYTRYASPQAVSQLGPTALQAGGNPNLAAMMALAKSSSGNVKYAPASDLVNGLADCSGSISDLVEVLQTGKTTPGRLFDTTAFATDASAAKLGFQPGFQPGALNVGVTPLPGMSGHMAATLPNGVNFEGGGGTGGGAQYGGSATGALDPQFSKRYHLPVGGAMSAYAPMTGAELTNPALTSPVGAGTGAGFPGLAGPPQSTTRIGGVAPTGGKGQGGIGYQQGGLIDLAIQGAAMGADMFAPGAGQVAQTGAKLLNRTIQYGGQLVGIGAQGVMDTFLPTGGSELANNNWVTRILGGIAGAGAAIPNVAGGKESPQGPLSPEQAAAHQQQQAVKGGDTNITVTNQRATEDGTGRDIAWHQEMANSAPGM